MPVLYAAVAALGLAIGSFLNVVVYRVPRGESLVHPPSHCPQCEQAIRMRHNLPVVGWLLLRGRCADCRAPISVRYPLVELGTAAVFVGVTALLHRHGTLWALPALLYFAAIGIALSAIDLRHRRLPDRIVLPSYPVLAVLLAIGAMGGHDPARLVRALVGGAALFAGYLVLAFVYPAGMGFGDVKLAGILGMVLGFFAYPALLVGALAPFLVAGIPAGALLLSGRAGRRTALPFGPFMAGCALLSIFAGAPIVHAYTSVLLGT